LEFVNYDRSHFYYQRLDESSLVNTTVEIRDAEDFKQRRLEENNPLGTLICPDPLFDVNKITYDIFRLSRGFGAPYYFVSERVVEKALKADLYGVVFHPIDEMPFKFV
jgi:hypothetical protein